MPSAPAATAMGSTPLHRAHRAVQGQLAHHARPCRASAGKAPEAARMPRAMGRSKPAPVFSHVGRGQVHGDAVDRHGKAGVGQGGAHPLLGFAHRAVGQAHGVEHRQARRQVHLYLDLKGIDPQHGQRCDTG
jgi:hypothetical protein